VFAKLVSNQALSAEDQLRLSFMFTLDLINRDALQATWEIQRTFDAGESCDTWGYARGWQVLVVDGRRILSHGGYSGTAYLRAVDDDLSVIVLTNREDAAGALSPLSLAWAAGHRMVRP
jgi:CubicO group peptidase (beta-lactamase class C family)